MKNRITKLVAIILTVSGIVSASLSTPTFAETDPCNLLNAQGEHVYSEEQRGALGCSGVGTVTKIEDVIISIINGILGLLAVVAVIVIVYAGVQYMTSTGDPAKTKKAKDTILYATIGLIICAIAATIVNFVITTIINAQK